MLNRRLRKFLLRLRSFMQAEILWELGVIRDQVARLRDDAELLHTALDRLHEAQQGLTATSERLHAEHEALRGTLARVDQFDQTARLVEDGLLTLALLRHKPAPDETN